MSRLQKAVLFSAATLFGVWLISNFGRLTADQEGTIRFVLGTVLALALLLRAKPAEQPAPARPRFLIPLLMGAGTLLTVLGIVFMVRQFEWLGIVLVFYACLRWALPAKYARDILLALLLFYWVHPLPSQVFGKFQLLMQKLSVKGAEWLLHCLNIRVWAEGFILRMGYRAFGVPEACSGMRTVVTVLLCTLGVTLLFRLRWYETLFFLAAGTFQVLLLNVLRITLMVYLAPRMPPEWAETFLHDTLGIFLLVAISLVQAEASGLKLIRERRARRQQAVRAGRRETADQATMLPRFWRRLLTWWLPSAAMLLLIAGVVFALYKRRPEHRVAMIRGVIESLMEVDLAAAEEALSAAINLAPADRDLLSKRVSVLVMRGKFGEALPFFDKLTGGLSTSETIMKSWALMALGEAEEAVALVDALPESARTIPGVAIIRAEYAARRGNPEEVSRNVVLAVRSHRVVERVRALFPYLALHEQWLAIADCSVNSPPFSELSQAMLAVHANLKINRVTEAAELLKYVLAQWPSNPLYLGSLFSLAVRRPGGRWEDFFAENMRANLKTLDVDLLAYYMNYCFQLQRPELGWLAYRRLQQTDPTDPALAVTPARFGRSWFVFRRRQIGIRAGNPEDVIDLAPFYRQFRHTAPFAAFWRQVPLAEELTREDFDALRSQYLKTSLEELQRREREGRLTLRMEMMYPTVLGMVGRYDEAHVRLDEVERKYPDMREEVLLQHAVFYDQRAEWQPSYEALVNYFGQVPQPNLTADLLMVNAMMNLNMGVCAMTVAERGRHIYPGSPQLAVAMAAIWDVFGFKEEALFALTRDAVEMRSRAFAQLLYDTGRYQEAETMSRAMGVEILRRAEERERYLPPPAEDTLAYRLPPPLTPAEMDAEAQRRAEAARTAVSPFIRRLAELQARWMRAHGAREASDPAAWREAGRNAMEQAAALHWLSLMLARQRERAAALAVSREAAALLPHSAIIRRVLIMLTEGEAETIRQARRACPEDSDVWLAGLVARTRDEGAGDWALEEVAGAIAAPRHPVAVVASAGDFLLRKGMTEAASRAAGDAIKRARGYVPAYVLGLKCAVLRRDTKGALTCALGGVANARDPRPFYRTIVAIKAAGRDKDSDLVQALEYLREQEAHEPAWAEQLGQVYFERHDMERVLAVLGPLIIEDVRGVRVQSLLLAAEAARLEGQGARAVDILETAHAMYPEKVSVLNNLIYSLAQDQRTLPRARQLLPGLLAMASDSFVVFDTAAMVYLRSGELTAAREYMERALNLLDEDDYAAVEVNLNAAEILFRSGEYDDARRRLMDIRRDPSISPMIDVNARQLLDQIREITRDS